MIQLLPAKDRKASPWKNGGGRTFEIAAHPPGADFETFDWRISLAEIEKDGPFSRFDGVDRILSLIEGRMTLEIGDPAQSHPLETASSPVIFAGESPVFARLQTPLTLDINLMTRRGRCRATLERLRLDQRLAIDAGAGLGFVFALTPLVLESEGLETPISRMDGAFFSGVADLFPPAEGKGEVLLAQILAA
jgi:environmental stress-induced protein Ves